MVEAYEFALAILYKSEETVNVTSSFRRFENHNLMKIQDPFYVGSTESQQTAVFRGASPSTKIRLLAKGKLHKLSATQAIKFTLSPYKNDWKSYLSDTVLYQITRHRVSITE